MSWTQVFSDTLAATGQTAKYGPAYFGHAHDEAGRHGWLFKKILMNRDMHELITSTDRISMQFMFQAKKVSRFHNPGQPRKRSNPQILATGAVDFAYQDDDLLFLDQEIILNTGAGDLGARCTQFAKLAKTKLLNLRHSQMEQMEDSAFDIALGSAMETVLYPNHRVPYSIFAFANESVGFSATNTVAAQTAALASHNGAFQTAAGGALATDWTAVAGIPITEERWRNGVTEFFHGSTAQSGTPNLYDSGGVVSAFDTAHEEVQFQTPTTSKNVFEVDNFNRQHVITELLGINHYRRVLRASNNTLAMGHQDSGSPNPSIYGAEMMRVQAFEDAAVYPNGDLTGLVTSSAGTPIGGTAADSACWGPRYLFWNASKLHPVWHEQRMLTKIHEYRMQGAEETNVQVYQSWWNWCPESRQRLHVVRGNLAATL